MITHLPNSFFKGVENGDLVVKGDSKSGVANACSRILLIVESSRSKMGHTHFISIPLNTKEMQEAQIKFKKDVLELSMGKGVDGADSQLYASNQRIDETVFQTPSLLHLTIGALSLLGKKYEHFKLFIPLKSFLVTTEFS